MELTDLKISEIKEVCKIMACTPHEANDLIESGDWSLLDENEAQEQVTDYIKESLWAFNPDFLSGETNIDIEVFNAIQANDSCEDNNKAMLKLVESTCGLESFVETALQYCGRGHFISGYDDEEHEVGEHFLYQHS